MLTTSLLLPLSQTCTERRQRCALLCGHPGYQFQVIRASNGEPPYYLSINRHQWASSDDLMALQHMAEEHIAKRISWVLPAYRLIRRRLRERARYEASIAGPSAFKIAKP
jgi:hypothetical protein